MNGQNGKFGYFDGGLYNVILCCNAKRWLFPRTDSHVRVPQEYSQRPNSV